MKSSPIKLLFFFLQKSFPPSGQFLNPLGGIMCQKNEQTHDSDILRKKEQDRSFKIKKHERGCQKHIK